jgi:GT2 family glycosyltransferase
MVISLKIDLNMKIGFVFTNYNNSKFSIEAVRSIFENTNSDHAHIVIVDNSSDFKNVKLLKDNLNKYKNFHLILNKNNMGYFKGLNCGIKYLRHFHEKLDLIVVGNNDLIFPINFIDSLRCNFSKLQHHAVISPNIITLDGVHQNPHVIHGISKFREIVFDLYYCNYYFALIIKKIAELTKIFTDRKDEEEYAIEQTIYQGYGACYILGPLFFKYFDFLWAPTFLFGEEYFLSMQLESKKLHFYYEPSIILKHHLHATMAKLQSKNLWKISRESHKVYRKYVKIWN